MVGVPVDPEDFDLAKVPDHLKITFRVTDERRRKLAEAKDLERAAGSRLQAEDPREAASPRRASSAGGDPRSSAPRVRASAPA